MEKILEDTNHPSIEVLTFSKEHLKASAAIWNRQMSAKTVQAMKSGDVGYDESSPVSSVLACYTLPVLILS